MAYTRAITVQLGSSKTGLVLTAQLYDTTGATVGGLIPTTTFTETSVLGTYRWVYTAFPDNFRGFAAIKSGATFLFDIAINPEDYEDIGETKVIVQA
jgi:hypothetical protein